MSRDRNIYGGILRRSSRNALFAVAIQFITSLCLQYELRLHPPSLFLSREDDDDVRDIGKQDFCSVLPHPFVSNALCYLLVTSLFQEFRSVHHIDYSSMPQASNKPRFHLNPLFRNPFNLKPPPFSQELFCLFITNCRLLLCNLSVKER